MEKIYNFLSKKAALTHALTLLQWDSETEAPKKANENIASTLNYLSELEYNLVMENREHILELSKRDDLSKIDKLTIKKLLKDLEEVEKLPLEFLKEFTEQVSITTNAWQEAREKMDYSIYKDKLVTLINLTKQSIKYLGYEGHPYNTLLNKYEEGLTVEICDKFFNLLKTKISPRLKEKRKNIENLKDKFFTIVYDIDKQRELSNKLVKEIGFDFNRGVIKESEHPFTTNIKNSNDVRITTHYYENNPISAVYSSLHEGGHALYEQNIGKNLMYTNILNSAISMSIHEAQSRFYENLIGKNDIYLNHLYTDLDNTFNISEIVNKNEFKDIVLEITPSLIRIEADEFTYPLHILIRYEMEKEIFSDLDKIEDADELSRIWNEKYEKYLNIIPTNEKDGIMQDVHWSQALFGYFPSYALGSAYASQIYHVMDKKLNMNKCIKEKRFDEILKFLTENIYVFGATKTPLEVIKDISDEEFNPRYYIDYLMNLFDR